MQLSSQTLLQSGKYKIIEKIGQGGFGIAYRAMHQGLQSEVCIKEFFYSDLCERAKDSSRITIISTSAEKILLVASFQKKFIKEAQRLAKFQHPNIVQVTDTFEENNTAYFVMEFLDGGSLDDLIRRDGAMSEQKAKALILPIIDAMDAVHKKDLLHLDIKPANIMLRKNQSPVLIDFGISKYLETANGNTTTAPIGISKGYAPLEQYGGSITDFSKATDVYSLCATIYNMVTGVTPPEPLQMLTNGFKSPRDLRPQLTPDFNAAILKGLSTKAVDRQQSMAQLKTAFGEVKNNAATTPQTVVVPVEEVLKTATEFYNRAEKKRKNKEYEAAIKDYSEAIKKNAKNENYYFLRGLCYHELENYNASIRNYSKAIELCSTFNGAYYNRGLCYSQLEKYNAATLDSYKAYEIEQKDMYFNQWFEMARKSDDLETINKYLSNEKWMNKDKVYHLRGDIFRIKKENIKAGDDYYQAYQLSKNEKYLDKWIESTNLELLTNYLDRNLPKKDEVELRIALNHLAEDNRSDFWKSLRSSKRNGNAIAANIINSSFKDYLLLIFILFVDVIQAYCYTEIIQNQLFYSGQQVFGIDLSTFWLLFGSLLFIWLISIAYSVKSNISIINPKWVRVIKRIHVFVLDLCIIGGSATLLFLLVFRTEYTTHETPILELIGGIVACVLLFALGIFTIFYFTLSLIASVDGNNNEIWPLEQVNDVFTIKYPGYLLDYFNN